MRKKVLIVGSSKLPVPATRGGAVPNLIEELLKQNDIEQHFDISCISLFDSKAKELSNEYIDTKFIWACVPSYIKTLDKFIYYLAKNIFRIKRLHSLSFLFQVIWYSFYIAKMLCKGNYDYVIFENSIPVLFSMKLFGNKKKYLGKYYLHMHSVPRKYYGNERIVNGCKKIICVSEYVKREIFNSPKLNLNPKQMSVMYNCIDTKKFKYIQQEEVDKFKQKINIPKDTKVILFVGRLCVDKGVEEVIKAVSDIKEFNYTLLIVGSNFYKSDIIGPYEEELRRLSSPIKEKLRFTGYIDYSKMPIVYNSADVIVLPSIWEEPAGMTIIEGMACKKPVITTFSGGIPEYTGIGNCVIVERNDEIVVNLKRHIINVISDVEYAKDLSYKGFERASKFNQNYYYKQLIDILEG